MLRFERIVRVPLQRSQHSLVQRLRISAPIGRIAVLVLRSRREIHLYVMRPLDPDRRSRRLRRGNEFPVRAHRHHRLKSQPIDRQFTGKLQFTTPHTPNQRIPMRRSQQHLIPDPVPCRIAVFGRHNTLRVRSPILRPVIDPALRIENPSHRIGDIQLPPVIGIRTAIHPPRQRPHDDISERLLRPVIAELRPSGHRSAPVDPSGQLLFGQSVRLRHPPRIEQSPHRSQVFPRPDLIPPVIHLRARHRTALPQALFRKLDRIGHHRPEKHRPHIPVADRKRFGHPVPRRSIIGQLERRGRTDRSDSHHCRHRAEQDRFPFFHP